MFVEALFGRAPNWKNPNVFQWLVKQTVEQLYHGILVSNKKEQIINIHNKVNEYPDFAE